MKLFFLVVFSFCVFFNLNFAAFAQNKTVSKKDLAELTEIYREFDESIRNLDVNAIEKYLAEDYKIKSGKEFLNKKQVIERAKILINSIRKISKVKSTIEKVKVVNENYVVDVNSTINGKLILPDGQIADFSFSVKSTDFWQKNQKREWREKSQIDRGSKTFINGKEIPTN